MINRSYKQAELYAIQSAAGTLKPTKEKVKVKDILIAISIFTGNKTQYNAINVSQSTHIGLTKKQVSMIPCTSSMAAISTLLIIL